MATISLSGLDLSFLKNEGKKKRRGKKTFKHEAAPSKRSRIGAPTVMSDIKPFMANAHAGRPIEITSRSQLARYERSNNIRQCGDIKNGEIISRTKKRAEESRRAASMADFRWE